MKGGVQKLLSESEKRQMSLSAQYFSDRQIEWMVKHSYAVECGELHAVEVGTAMEIAGMEAAGEAAGMEAAGEAAGMEAAEAVRAPAASIPAISIAVPTSTAKW